MLRRELDNHVGVACDLAHNVQRMIRAATALCCSYLASSQGERKPTMSSAAPTPASESDPDYTPRVMHPVCNSGARCPHGGHLAARAVSTRATAALAHRQRYLRGRAVVLWPHL